jgi:hypothetical protein
MIMTRAHAHRPGGSMQSSERDERLRVPRASATGISPVTVYPILLLLLIRLVS